MWVAEMMYNGHPGTPETCQEAGGRFTDFAGNATIHGGSAISTNAKIHDQVLKIISAN